ncbi:hypothetical protein [Actinokineospora iranica]|uniref:Excreted virulence factor EspC, type VII ESX diderm n=1 Tax=Actinokineospora iranica TaxID=1271860 RepID=A0A1G6YXZ1_9PSEU|nr:hypothetical protein [Actinokineospora iranica]SDD95374.1 hypothetical protein SAMN05216174_12442 [Actinokineospora iranica]
MDDTTAGGAIGSGLGDQIAQMRQGSRGFLTAAQRGEFGVSENAGKAIITAIHTVLDGIDGLDEKVKRISQDTKLGTSPDALVMRAFNKDVAAGPNSAASSLRDLRDLLIEVEAGITEAMRHYRNTDDHNRSTLTRKDQ